MKTSPNYFNEVKQYIIANYEVAPNSFIPNNWKRDWFPDVPQKRLDYLLDMSKPIHESGATLTVREMIRELQQVFPYKSSFLRDVISSTLREVKKQEYINAIKELNHKVPLGIEQERNMSITERIFKEVAERSRQKKEPTTTLP